MRDRVRPAADRLLIGSIDVDDQPERDGLPAEWNQTGREAVARCDGGRVPPRARSSTRRARRRGPRQFDPRPAGVGGRPPGRGLRPCRARAGRRHRPGRPRTSRGRPSAGGRPSSARARCARPGGRRAGCRRHPVARVQGPGVELVGVLRFQHASLLRPRRHGASRPFRRRGRGDGGRQLREPGHVVGAAGLLPVRCDRVQRRTDQRRPALARRVQVPGPPLVQHRHGSVARQAPPGRHRRHHLPDVR